MFWNSTLNDCAVLYIEVPCSQCTCEGNKHFTLITGKIIWYDDIIITQLHCVKSMCKQFVRKYLIQSWEFIDFLVPISHFSQEDYLFQCDMIVSSIKSV